MFRVINFSKLIRYVALATTFVSLLTYQLINTIIDLLRTPLNLHFKNVDLLNVAPWVSLAVIFVLTSNVIARFIWRVLAKFGWSPYPDLNGTWEGEITTQDGKTVSAKASIRQTLLQTQIDMHTRTSKSITLEATPVKDRTQNKLYYIYVAKPKDPSWGSYTGSTIFDVRSVERASSKNLELSGYYYTDRKTIGRIRLQQINADPSLDISYY